jgi:exonuclease VII small subunit
VKIVQSANRPIVSLEEVLKYFVEIQTALRLCRSLCQILNMDETSLSAADLKGSVVVS